MPGWFWRIVIAVVVAIFVYWVIVPLAAIFHFPLSGPVMTVIQASVACGSVLYVIFGSPPPPPWR